MSSKRLIPLVALLVVLIIAAVMLKRQPAPSNLSHEVGFERLVPQTLQADRISGLDLYQGATPQEVVRLRRQEDSWVVASYYNAPVQANKIASFLNTLSALEGDLRADSAELLGDFRLEPAQALHLQVYLDNSETPEVHLLAGKNRGRHSFVRLSDGYRVYDVNLNLHHEAGLYGSHAEQPPQARPWIELQIQNIPREHITEVALHTPMHRWRFVRQQPNAPAADAPQGTPKTEPHWTLAEPDVEYAVKQGQLDGLATTLRTLRAEDIANPASVAEYGLNDALYRAILVVQPEGQETRKVTLWVGREVPEQAGKRYARVGTEGPIYILPQWTFERLFPKAEELLDLTTLSPSPAAPPQIQ